MKNISAKKWIFSFIAIFLGAALLMGFVSYSVDPFMYYRVGDDEKLMKARFVNVGIAKNYDYDMAFIGSSMIQNFDMPYFRENYDVNPVKLVAGGMTLNEILKLYNISQEYSGADKYMINIDPFVLNTDGPIDFSSSRFPDYLYNDEKLDDVKYLLGYEVWFRYIPVNFAVNTLLKMGIDLPEKFDDAIDIDKIEDWSKDFSFGKEIVKQNYEDGAYATSELNTNDMYSRMTKNIDSFLKVIVDQEKDGQEIIFGFPPYSALYWHESVEHGEFDTLMDVKEYFIAQCDKYDFIRVVDLQSIPEITDLSRYKDASHYDTGIQKDYADAVFSGKFDINADTFEKNKLELQSLIEQFEKENADWLK